MTTEDPDKKPPDERKVDWLLIGILIAVATIVILFLSVAGSTRM